MTLAVYPGMQALVAADFCGSSSLVATLLPGFAEEEEVVQKWEQQIPSQAMTVCQEGKDACSSSQKKHAQ
jgi:hypothetical protein